MFGKAVYNILSAGLQTKLVLGESNIYTDFAYVYDKLMHDVDYKKWADYIEGLFKVYNHTPSLVLDLGCGTGNFCIEMSKRGYDMIGVDISGDMLACAKEKSVKAGLDILFLNQDMTNFELYGTVDAIVCLIDSINYITHKKDLKRLFKLAKNYLNPKGLFIFDINSEYKLEKVLGNNLFYEIEDDITYIWENQYHKKKKICEFDITFFVRDQENNLYKKYEEVHYERAYSHHEVEKLIKDSGLSLIKTYDELTYSNAHKKSKRVFYICTK
ncbi:MAG: class I SAM-dependent methyltransferase [Clostridia bacterium]|nr:class I SAM-dependent methyltransferase [Clostridia bacterium]